MLHGIPCGYPLLSCLPVAILVSDHFMCFSEGIRCCRAPSLSPLISYVHVYEYNHKTQITGTPEHAIQLLDVDSGNNLSFLFCSDAVATGIILVGVEFPMRVANKQIRECESEFYGTRESTHKWISSWLSECSQKWCWMDKHRIQSRSYLVSPRIGLRTVLFTHFFINDLPENIRSSVRLFADNCVFYRNIKSPMQWIARSCKIKLCTM